MNPGNIHEAYDRAVAAANAKNRCAHGNLMPCLPCVLAEGARWRAEALAARTMVSRSRVSERRSEMGDFIVDHSVLTPEDGREVHTLANADEWRCELVHYWAKDCPVCDRDRLRDELAAGAHVTAQQCALARQAEIERDRLAAELEAERERTRLIFTAMQPGLDVLGVGGGDADPTDFAGVAERCVADRDRLAAELAAGAHVTAQQCALARQAEIERDRLAAELAERTEERDRWRVKALAFEELAVMKWRALDASEAQCAALTEALGWYASDGRVRGALSDGRIAAMARLLEAGKTYWVAGGKLRANMPDAETWEARRQLTLAQIELHAAMRDLWGEGGGE